MSSDTHDHLLNLCDAYASHRSISRWRVSFLARGDGMFFKRLADGKSCTIKTADQVLRWFSDNWPADLEWPRDIPRPAKPKREAA